jgi:ribose/xylose/arabinose/galactoside ABC-type transport system permease subunit/ABC-type sugar transport system substrate-binding protein
LSIDHWHAIIPLGVYLAVNRRYFLQLVTAAALAPAAPAAASHRTVALLFDSLVSPFWIAAREALRAEIEDRGWSVLEAVSNMDDTRQYTQVESMIQNGVDGIVIVHTDAKAVIPAIRAANAAGIPMVHFNRAPAENDAYSVAVVADNRKLMDETVTRLITELPPRADPYRAAILLGDLGDANGASRRDGFTDAVARFADRVDVVARVATEWNADKAFAGLGNALRAHPDIDMIVTSSDFLTPQIEQALRIAGKWYPSGEAGHVFIAGFDGDDNGYAQLAAGYYEVDGVQNLYYEVDLTLGALEQLWAGAHPPKILIDPGFVITRKTLLADRERMWGYRAWKEKQPTALGLPPAASPAIHASAASTGEAGTINGGFSGIGVRTGEFLTVMFSSAALRDIALAIVPLAILAVGQMLVLLIGQIDLSMTAVLGLSSILSASAMSGSSGAGGGRSAVGIATCLLTGVVIGLFNGVCTAILRMPAFIVTLAVMMAGSGAAVWYASTVSDTVSIGNLPRGFISLGYGTLVHVPITVLICLGVLTLVRFVLTRTVAGRWLYALGQNAEAARISGVPTSRLTIAAFTASGLCAGLAAMIYTSRLETGIPTLGQNLLLDIVGAAVVGGVSLFGGRGSVWMALGGAAFFCILDKSLQLLGLSLFIVLAVKGATILVATILDAYRRRVRN